MIISSHSISLFDEYEKKKKQNNKKKTTQVSYHLSTWS